MYRVMYNSNAHYVSCRAGVYYYTRRVPIDVRQYYSSPRLSFSLRTKSYAGAARAAQSVTQRLEDYWLGLRLQDMDDSCFIEKKLQRPVGYSATTRVHMGRLCIPMLNDSGATCSLLTEEQVILVVNHTLKMVEEKKMSMDDYNYPIRQFFRFRESAYMKGAEKEGKMAVEFAIVICVEFIPEGCQCGPVKEI